MQAAVTVVGSVNVDLVVTVDRLPAAGETVVGTDVHTAPGGKGANQAAAAAALSGAVALIAAVGDDDAGAVMRGDLADRGVDVTGMHSTDLPTGSATIAVDRSGENLIIVAPGANHGLTAAAVTIDAVRDAAVLLLQLEIPLAVATAAARHTQGLVLLNPAPAQPLPAALLDAVDVLVPNEPELAALAGGDPAVTEPATLAALARGYAPDTVVVVTLGARGALIVSPGQPSLLVAPPTVTPVDTTGAGDCFCGSLAVALAEGRTIVSAVRFAVIAAALSTTARGARGGYADADTIAAALRSLPASRSIEP